MYSNISGLVIGFHGCDRETGEAVLRGKRHLKSSTNDYDWLGHGVYFWENAPQRARDFACWKRTQKGRKGGAMDPFVVGAVLDLGNCLNLQDTQHHPLLRRVYEFLEKKALGFGIEMPENTLGGDKLLRRRDCAVIQAFHAYASENNAASFDTVRSAFEEGEPVYPGAGFRDKTHIQICVRNPSCIKGYFRPIDENGVAVDFG